MKEIFFLLYLALVDCSYKSLSSTSVSNSRMMMNKRAMKLKNFTTCRRFEAFNLLSLTRKTVFFC